MLRTGRMTPGQQRAFEENWQRWGLDYSDGLLDSDQLLARRAPGAGDRLWHGPVPGEMAAAAPDTNFIGIEVHSPGVGKLLHAWRSSEVDNIRVYCHDAVEVLRDCIPETHWIRYRFSFPTPGTKSATTSDA